MARKFKTPITIDELGSASSQALAANVDGDSQNRVNIDAGGKITWGSGSATGDTTLYRSAADTLKTDDAFTATSLAITGQFTLPTSDGSADQVITTNGSGTLSWADVAGGATVSDTAPSSPSVGDIWFESDTGDVFVYYDSTWVDVGGTSVANIAMSDTAPADPGNGDFWFETDTGKTFVYYNDGSSSQWIEVGAASAAAFGADGAIQFASGGTFSSDASNLFWDDSNNRLGIGTVLPVTQLHLAGDDDREALRLSGAGGSGSNQGSVYMGFHHWETGTHPSARIGVEENGTGDYDGSLVFQTRNSDSDVVPSTRMVVDQDGNVGIGTTSPETPLNIVTTNKLGATFTGTTDGEGLRVDQSNYTSGNYVSLIESSYQDTQTAPHVRIAAQFTGSGSLLHFGTSNNYSAGVNNQAMTIDRLGNVGIGTTSPSYPLSFGAPADGSQQIALYESGLAGYGIGTDQNRVTIFAANSGTYVERMVIRGDTGNVGIGTTNPAEKLSVAGDVLILDTNPTLTLKDSDSTGASNGSIVFKDSADTALGRIQMNANDDMGIAALTSTSTMYFYTHGDWRFYMTSVQFLPYVDNSYDLGATSKRFDDVYATNGTIQTSDERDKTDVANIDYGLNFINSLRPVTYRWDDRSGYTGTRTHMGFIAQEVETVLGDDAATRAVWVDSPAGEYKNADTGEMEPGVERQSLRYEEMIAPMVKAIQELTARIEALEAN